MAERKKQRKVAGRRDAKWLGQACPWPPTGQRTMPRPLEGIIIKGVSLVEYAEQQVTDLKRYDTEQVIDAYEVTITEDEEATGDISVEDFMALKRPDEPREPQIEIVNQPEHIGEVKTMAKDATELKKELGTILANGKRRSFAKPKDFKDTFTQADRQKIQDDYFTKLIGACRPIFDKHFTKETSLDRKLPLIAKPSVHKETIEEKYADRKKDISAYQAFVKEIKGELTDTEYKEVWQAMRLIAQEHWFANTMPSAVKTDKIPWILKEELLTEENGDKKAEVVKAYLEVPKEEQKSAKLKQLLGKKAGTAKGGADAEEWSTIDVDTIIKAVEEKKYGIFEQDAFILWAVRKARGLGSSEKQKVREAINKAEADIKEKYLAPIERAKKEVE